MSIGVRIRDEGVTPTIPEHTPEYLATLMKRTWEFDPSDRISFIEAVTFLLKHTPTSRSHVAAVDMTGNGSSSTKKDKKPNKVESDDEKPISPTAGYSTLDDGGKTKRKDKAGKKHPKNLATDGNDTEMDDLKKHSGGE